MMVNMARISYQNSTFRSFYKIDNRLLNRSPTFVLIIHFDIRFSAKANVKLVKRTKS